LVTAAATLASGRVDDAAEGGIIDFSDRRQSANASAEGFVLVSRERYAAWVMRSPCDPVRALRLGQAGEVSERLKELVSKTSVRVLRTGGSNPPLSVLFDHTFCGAARNLVSCQRLRAALSLFAGDSSIVVPHVVPRISVCGLVIESIAENTPGNGWRKGSLSFIFHFSQKQLAQNVGSAISLSVLVGMRVSSLS
jgi:hypothetical protein